jgi:hypothetical protein
MQRMKRFARNGHIMWRCVRPGITQRGDATRPSASGYVK